MPTNPYLKADGTGQLLDSFVLYLDLLGSREWARTLDDGGLEELREILAGRRWFLHDDKRDNERQRIMSFTDNLVLGVPYEKYSDDAGLLFVVTSCVYYQLNLAARGRFLRGGLTTGRHFMDDRLVAGPALVEAVDLEHAATFPRVLLSNDAIQMAIEAASRSLDDPWAHYLLQDEDDHVFINYLPGVADDGIPGWDLQGLLVHRAQIVESLLKESLSDRTKDKYVWAANYHNFVCRRAVEHPRSFPALSSLNLDQLEVRDELPPGNPARRFRPVPGLAELA